MGIKFLKSDKRFKWVSLRFECFGLILGRVEDGLDFVGVDDTGKIGVGHCGGRDALSTFSVDGIKLVKGSLGPDAESSHVSTGCELQNVQTVDAAKLDTGKIAEGKLDSVVGGVDNKRTTTHGVSSVTHLTLTGTDLLRVSSLFDIIESTDGGKDILGGGGLLGGFNRGIQDKRNFRDFVNDVSTGHDKGRDGGSGQGGGNGVSLLANVDLLVPLAPGLGGSEHASSTTHVTESSLSGSGGTSSSYTGNTGDGTSGTPRGSRNLLSSADGHGVSLTLVLVDIGVNKLDDVRTERSRHNSGESSLSGFVAGEGENANKGTGGHGGNSVEKVGMW
mmetsp:Transcript_4103/g.9238  ORF Transcript_4103/g.9238 Transcript_4103/m.9238 type:complete len:333 (+) Transcript_4103:280-1278(+)